MTIAPACPIVFPSGALDPEINATIGLGYFSGCFAISSARISSWHPPISPAITMRSVFSYCCTTGTISRNLVPIAPSPPIPNTAFCAIPTLARASDIW